MAQRICGARILYKPISRQPWVERGDESAGRTMWNSTRRFCWRASASVPSGAALRTSQRSLGRCQPPLADAQHTSRKTDKPRPTVSPALQQSQPRESEQSQQRFLAGPRGRLFELLRALRVFAEMLRGFRALHFAGPCVTVFGSARFADGHPHYNLARETAAAIARDGWTIMTGGGPGIMEAANRGAKDVNGHSIGCNIELPHEQQPNPYLDLMIEFRYFFVRKVMLVKYSYAFVVLPGGFGTLDELFEILTLIQTGKVHDFRVVLMGKAYWQQLLDLLATMTREGTIGPEDLERLVVTDFPDEARDCIRACSMQRFGTPVAPSPPQPLRWLGEHAWYRQQR